MVKKKVRKTNQSARGLYKALWTEVQKFGPSVRFSTEDVKHLKSKDGKPYTNLQLHCGLDYLTKTWKVIEPRDENKMWATKAAEGISPPAKKKRKSPRKELGVKTLYNLLDAMAAAEPDIRRLIDVHHKVQKFLTEGIR